jgi:hypothetical protein
VSRSLATPSHGKRTGFSEPYGTAEELLQLAHAARYQRACPKRAMVNAQCRTCTAQRRQKSPGRGAAAAYAAGALTGGAATYLYKATKVVSVARSAVKTGTRGVSIPTSRLTSRIAGRMWTMGQRAQSTRLPNGSRLSSYAHHHYRSPARKGKKWSSNLEFTHKGRHDYINVDYSKPHVVEKKNSPRAVSNASR